MKKIILTSVIFWFSFTASAQDDYCPQTLSAVEGNYPIRESQFTKKKAESGLKFLGLFVKNGIKYKDLALVKNRLTMVEGYLLKTQVSEKKPETKKIFCNFIKNKAFLQF